MTPEKRLPAKTSDDAAPPTPDEQNTSPGVNDATFVLPPKASPPKPPPADIPPLKAAPSDLTEAGRSDKTLPPSHLTSGGGANDTSKGVHSDATLPPPKGTPRLEPTVQFVKAPEEPSDATLPPSGGPRLDMTQPFMKSAAAGPSDATLNPGDQAAKEFHTAALKQAASEGRAGRSAAVTTGASFGHYELLAPIAKGGMGIVYKARQRNLNRIVAIKMILSGQFADQTDVDRFYAEAEAAAALSHPNIVAIHEIGEVQGQHFFSMDFVDGQSLAALVQESPLTPRRSAELMVIISETMQFAHEKGIVHRDLKPGNVLLDKKQRPLITDFGLAKHVSNTSQMTMAGAVVGTPSYMPPEQASGKGDEVGPLSDLYSLGAILYECLTGRPPFRAANPFETIRQVINTEPPSPRLLNPSVPPDLETICLKCLQKDRHQRYGSAQELADELARFLRGEPIQARPITNVERFWRLCKRNPVTSASIAVATLMLFALSGVSTYAYFKTSAALAESEESLRDAMEVVDLYFTTTSESTLLNQPGVQPVRTEMLQMALSYYERFLKQRGNDPTIQNELARTLWKVGRSIEVLQSSDEALPSYLKAREMQEGLLAARPNDPKRLRPLGDTLVSIGTVYANKKDFPAARTEFGNAVAIREKLVALDQADSEYHRLLASSHMNLGLTERMAALSAKDEAERDAGFAKAREQYEKAQGIRQAALAKDGTYFKLRLDLAKGYFNLGNFEASQSRNEQAQQQFKSAGEEFERLVKEFTELPEESRKGFNHLDNQRSVALCFRRVADSIFSANADEARKWYNKALNVLEPLARNNPYVTAYQTDLGEVLLNFYGLELEAGDAKTARAILERARDIQAPLADRFPDEPAHQQQLAMVLRELAKQQDATGDSKLAAENLKKAIDILSKLAAHYPDDAEIAAKLEDAKKVTLASTAPSPTP